MTFHVSHKILVTFSWQLRNRISSFPTDFDELINLYFLQRTSLRMTMAPDQDPPPPRHCLEDMDLIAPVD
jgi:hypothetical protein